MRSPSRRALLPDTGHAGENKVQCSGRSVAGFYLRVIKRTDLLRSLW